MKSKDLKIDFPLISTIDKIEEIAQMKADNNQEITHQLSVFDGLSTDRIVELAKNFTIKQKNELTADELDIEGALNGAVFPVLVKFSPGMSCAEKNGIKAAAQILDADSNNEGQIIYVDDEEIAERDLEANREITSQVMVDGVRQIYKAFMGAVLKEDISIVNNEYLQFGTRNNKNDFRKVKLPELHYWKNIGLIDLNDSLRDDVLILLKETYEEYKEEFEVKIFPYLQNALIGRGLAEGEQLSDEDKEDIGLNLSLAMFSNFSRGHYYKHLDPNLVDRNNEGTYLPRAIAVETADKFR